MKWSILCHVLRLLCCWLPVLFLASLGSSKRRGKSSGGRKQFSELVEGGPPARPGPGATRTARAAQAPSLITTGSRRRHGRGAPANATRRDLELKLRYYEHKRLAHVLEVMKLRGYKIRGFYHTSAWQPYWRHVIAEQLMLMDGKRINVDHYEKYESGKNDTITWNTRADHEGPSLLSIIDALHMTIAGSTYSDFETVYQFVDNSLPMPIMRKRKKRIEAHFNLTVRRGSNADDRLRATKELESMRSNAATSVSVYVQGALETDISEGEFSTISALYDYCTTTLEPSKSLVFYLHNKGGCCTRAKGAKGLPVATWREFMNTFTIEFPSICLGALLNGYSACGVNLQNSVPTYPPHFSGNFWWARCDHITQLKRPSEPFNAHALEFLISDLNRDGFGSGMGSAINDNDKVAFAKECIKSVHHCRVNHYDTPCNRTDYLKIVAANVLERVEFPVDAPRLVSGKCYPWEKKLKKSPQK